METENLGKLSRRRFLKLGGGVVGATLLNIPGVFAQEVNTDLQGTVVVSISANSPQEAVDELLAAYKVVRPNVEVLWEAQNLDASTYPTWLGAQVNAQPIRPDIVSGNYFATYAGYLNLDTVRYTTNPHTGNMWGDDLNWDFFRGVNSLNERIMLPTRGVHISWYYNRDMFAEAGVEPPTNWDEFAEVCAKLAETFPDIAPTAVNYQWMIPQWTAMAYYDQYHLPWIETVRSQPGDWTYLPEVDDNFVYDPNIKTIHNTYTLNLQRYYAGLRDGVLRFDTPEIAEQVKNTSMIFPRYAPSDFFNITDVYPRFLGRQAAIMLNTTGSLSALTKDFADMTPERLEALGLTGTNVEPFAWGTFENPPMEGPLIKSPVRTSESASGEYVSIIEKDAEQTALALDFMQFWLSEPGYSAFGAGMATAASPSYAGPVQVYGVQDPPEVEALWEQITWLGSSAASYNYQFLTWGGGEIATTAKQVIWKEGLEGTVSPEDTAARLQDLITTNFDAILELIGLTHADLDNPARQPGE